MVFINNLKYLFLFYKPVDLFSSSVNIPFYKISVTFRGRLSFEDHLEKGSISPGTISLLNVDQTDLKHITSQII